ncbi:CUB and sushi domain-containing protein [Mytilus galloprovincialis]|uniref:CUB and sushi domain-containing protein n=1 Tax=Mytilus galloprovincialis TaxID=29158 RepID=A0A8B6CM31_MYTGA|nr:CUB and sushi domain-containing protein [Mytilus galloprovincialis]
MFNLNFADEYTLCEGNSTNLECCLECSIQILEATYGRTNSIVCPHDTVFNSTKYNYTNSASTNVSNACDGKQSCLLNSTNDLYDDPSPGVFKYLNVTYECLKAEITTEKTSANFDLTTPDTDTDPLAYTEIITENTKANIDLTTPDTDTHPLAYTEIITENTTANIDLTTPDTDTHPLACRCPCSEVGPNKWGYLRDLNVSLAQLEEILKPDLNKLHNLIAINKKNTTMNLRTKYSAADDRISAVSIGLAGATIICLVPALFVVMDLIECFR